MQAVHRTLVAGVILGGTLGWGLFSCKTDDIVLAPTEVGTPEGERRRRKKMRTGTNLYFSMLVFAALAISSTAQTGGTFDLSHNVIASGGGASSGANGTRTFSVEGTIGQGFAGTTSTSTSPQFSVRGGFWAFQPLAPTAATVTVAGRVTAQGRGLGLARVLMTNSAGDTRTAITNIFGYYSFADVPVGETFLVTVSYPRYNFAPRVLVVDDEITGFDFVALLRSGSK